VEPAARQFKLDFVPLIKERYMLACSVPTLSLPAVKELIAMLQDNKCPLLAAPEPGYALDEPGSVVKVQDVVPWIGY